MRVKEKQRGRKEKHNDDNNNKGKRSKNEIVLRNVKRHYNDLSVEGRSMPGMAKKKRNKSDTVDAAVGQLSF